MQLRLTAKDNSGIILGKGYYENSYFNQTSSLRLLKKTVDGTGQFSKVFIENKNFVWTVSLLETSKMNLQLTFEDP